MVDPDRPDQLVNAVAVAGGHAPLQHLQQDIHFTLSSEISLLDRRSSDFGRERISVESPEVNEIQSSLTIVGSQSSEMQQRKLP